MHSFELKTVYLDTLYKDIFERYLIRKKLITKTIIDSNEQKSDNLEPLKLPLTGLKKMLVLLTLFENVDSNSSIYDFSRLIDMGLVNENSTIGTKENNVAYSDEYISEATRLMNIYKRDIIRFLKRKDRVELKFLQTRSEAKEFWKTVDNKDRFYICTDVNGKPLELDSDYDNIIANPDILYSGGNYFMNPEDGLIFDLVNNRHIDLDIGSIRDNLIEGLFYSKKQGASFASGIFSDIHSTNTIECIDSVYYTIQARLPNEVNILPMPQCLDDVLKMRKSPYIHSFRKVMNEWCSYVETGEYLLANKISKDLVKANKALDHLDRYKRFSQSPYTRVFNLFGGLVPYLGILLGGISFVEPYIIEHLQEKNQWTLLTKNLC